MCLLLLQTTFSRFVFGHLFFYCHVGYWFFSSGNINYAWLFCFSSVTIALCLLYSPSGYHFPFHFSFVASIAICLVVLTFIGVHLH
jgi:hypothetical protein